MGLQSLQLTSGTSAAPFTPTSIAGLRVWLSTRFPTTINAGSPVDNDPVSSWTDKSSNAYSFAQGTGASQPLYKTNVQNGNAVLRFDHSNDFIGAAVGTDMTDFSVFVVLNITTFRQFDCIVGSNVQGTGQTTIELGGVSQFDCYDANVGSKMPTGLLSAPTATWLIINVTYTQTTPAGVFYITNASAGTTNQASMFLESANLNIGDDGAAGFTAFGGDIGEVIIYPSVLSTTDRNSVYNYLKTAWGL